VLAVVPKLSYNRADISLGDVMEKKITL